MTMTSIKNAGNTSITITVKFYGVFRKIAGKKELTHQTTTRTLKDALNELTSRLPPQFKEALIDQVLDNPTPNALILINGKEMSVLEGLGTLLKNGDTIIIIPISHGGLLAPNI